MNIAGFCIKHKVTTILAFILIAVFGFALYSDLKLTLIPEIEYPAAYVTCYYNGAGPEEIEELVTRPLESVIATIPGVEKIDSTSQENMSTIMIEYSDGTDLEVAANKLRERFDQLTLPEGCNDPILYNLDISAMMPVVAVAMMGEDLSSLQTAADKIVSPSLERIDGVAAVQVYGGMDAQITVATDATRLAGYGLTISQISSVLAANNVLLPGGPVDNGTQSLTVSTDGKLKSVADVAQILIPLPAGGTVRLSEVAHIFLEEDRQDTVAKSNDSNCVVLAVNRQSNVNEVDTARQVKAALDKVAQENPALDFLIVHDSSEYIERTASNAVQNIIMGIVLAAFVVLLFLRRPGATATIVVSMPFCILTVFLVMKFFDITLNMISLGGIAMGVGMIVDNSIVVLENIYRYAADGYSRYDSCVKGTKEVTLPITASTLTTVAVFLPIGLSGGLSGMLFRDFSLTVVFLLLASLLIALTLVPLLCYFLLDEKKAHRRRMKHDEKAPPFADLVVKMRQGYLKILKFFIRKRWVAMLISLGMVVLFVVSCMSTNSVLMPDVDQGELTVSISMPAGTEVEQTIVMADRAVEIVQANCPELESLYYSATAGSADVVVSLVNVRERSRSSKEVANDLRKMLADLAGCEISIGANSMASMASNSSDIYVEISGDDFKVLEKISNDLAAQIEKIPGAVNIKSSMQEATPAVKVNINREAAAMYGLNPAIIGSAVRAELSGVTATTMTMNGKDLDVVIKGNEVASENLDALRSMPLAALTGGQVPLSAVADVVVELTPQSINRFNQSRQVNISGELGADGELTQVNQEIMAIIDAYEMPEGYNANAGGTYEDMMTNFGSLFLALGVALGLVYFVLASQFESFLMPLIVMLILPVALTGALFGLPLTGSDLSMVAIIGLIMLAGVVVNASIILVDYIKVRRLMGESKEDAILEACPLRIRPILMTTLTTILAMVPMSLGIGDGAELMQPMSIVMISGMVISTIVTLFFTPVYYSVLDSFGARVASLFKRKEEGPDEQAPEAPLG